MERLKETREVLVEARLEDEIEELERSVLCMILDAQQQNGEEQEPEREHLVELTPADVIIAKCG